MGHCNQCGNFQSRLNRGKICDGCNNSQRSTSSMDGMNTYFDSSMFNSANAHPSSGSSRMLAPQNGTPMNPPMNPPGGFIQQQQHQQQQFPPNGVQRMPPPVRMNAPGTQTSAITPDNLNNLLEKPINELTVADIIQINLISNEPIRQQLSTLETDFKKKFQSMEDRMNIIENEISL